MRVGIISVYDNENIGNKLQNYALQQTLLNYADEVITIKNKPAFVSAADYVRRASFLAESVLMNQLAGKRRKAQLLRFQREYIRTNNHNYCYTKTYASLKRKDHCTLYCAGSDQIWNPNLGRTEGFSFLEFAERNATFAYAASFGVSEIPEKYKERVSRGLQHIMYLSVREEAGKQITKELTGRMDVRVLVDPTMLLSCAQWDRVMAKPKAALPQKYLLTYFLGEVPHRRRSAVRQKAEELGCEIIELMDPNSPFYEIGPGEFLYLIKHAVLVCTDSFHGSVFAFLYQRPLCIFCREGEQNNMGSRLETLTAKFGLEKCLVQEDRLKNVPLVPDYTAGYRVLEEERSKAIEYLSMVFNQAKRAGL